MSDRVSPELQEIRRRWDECKTAHSTFSKAYERRERAYRGVLEFEADAAKWKHKLHPPYAFNLIETMVANTVEQGLRFQAKPAPRPGLSLEDAQEMLVQAEAVEDLIRHEHRIDYMDEKQRPLFLTEAIGGVGVLKSHWRWETGTVRRQGVKNTAFHDDEGRLLGYLPTIEEIVEHGVVRDHSTAEVVDPRDFVMHESARTLQPTEPGGAQYVFHRAWYSYEQLKSMEASGFLKNVDDMKNRGDAVVEFTDRDTSVFNLERGKDMIQVLEYWCYKRGEVHRTITGGEDGCSVILRAEEAVPFWHNSYPFVLSHSMPLPFSPRGMAAVELIEELQMMLWEITNQRLDNLELINNAIFLIRSDVEDPEAFEFYPGAFFQVDDPQQINTFAPPYQLAEVTLQAEALLKGDLQNVTSAAPFASGAQSASVDQKTATGASIVMAAAQRHLASRKYQAQFGLKREAEMRLKNCQQFIDGKRLVHILGPDGAQTFREIPIVTIQGEYSLELTPIAESMMRQERRAESMQLAQMLSNIAPLAAASGTPVNVQEVLHYLLKAWDVEDWRRFVSATPKPQVMQQGQGGAAAGGGAAPPGQSNMGITAESAVDASSPSATGGQSLSPEMMMQRALAFQPGPGGPMGG